MLRWRLIGAAAIIFPVLLLLWLDDQCDFGFPGLWFAVFLVAAGVLCCCELAHLVAPSVAGLSTALIGVMGGIAMLFPIVARFWPIQQATRPMGNWGWAFLGLAVAIAISLVWEMRSFQSGRGATQRIAYDLLCVAYVLVPFNYMFQLRMWSANRLGLLAFVSVVFIAKFADAGAYFTGRTFGRHPLAPILSPKKTVEGALGGLVVAAAASWGYFHGIMPWLWREGTVPATWAIVGFALTIALCGMLGDLSVSLFKRDVAQKDSARLLPGLGGSLDILDSVLWAAPVGYLWWMSGALG